MSKKEIEDLFDKIHSLESEYFIARYSMNYFVHTRGEVIKLLEEFSNRLEKLVMPKIADIEFRPNIDDIDEIVADNCRLHLEYMDNDLIWMDIELPNGDEYHVNIYHRNGKTKAWLKTSGEKVG